jgi:AcrR family transcriptional regulator
MSKENPAIAALLSNDPGTRRRRQSTENPEKETTSPPDLNELDRLNQIYFFAARLFCEKGYDATSMSAIAEATGITKAGVYHFIPGGKKDLLFAIMSYGLDRLDRAVIEPVQTIADAEQRLRAIITNHVKLVTRGSTEEGFNPVTVVVDEVAGLSPAHKARIDQRKRVYVDLIRQTLEELREEGKLKEVDVTVVAFSLLGMVLWLARWYRPNCRLTGDQMADEICKMALGGIMRQ